LGGAAQALIGYAPAMFEGWDDYYLLVGSAAAAPGLRAVRRRSGSWDRIRKTSSLWNCMQAVMVPM